MSLSKSVASKVRRRIALPILLLMFVLSAVACALWAVPFAARGEASFVSTSSYNQGGSSFVAVADFNNDGIPDLATTNAGGTVQISLGKGDGTFQTATGFAVGPMPIAIAIADFNGDSPLDLAVAYYQPTATGYTQRCGCCWATATARFKRLGATP